MRQQRWHDARFAQSAAQPRAGDIVVLDTPPDTRPDTRPAGRASSFDVDRLARRYRRTGAVAARNLIVEEYCWLADRCARQFAHRGEPLPDLIQVARLGLVKAAERFDPDRGSKFESFARPTITGELRRHFRDRAWSVSVPRRCKDLRPLVRSAREHLEQELGRPATVDEIADLVDRDRDEIAATITANAAYRTRPLDRPNDDDTGGGWRQRLASDDTWPGDRLEVLAMVKRLDDRSRMIVYWHFFEDRTQRDIGTELGIGQVQVSRLLKAALSQLRSTLEPAVPAPAA
ncbi:MAG: sigma-70 family RNA polymerase sigma factor [Ilumatobacteraceae bacterium]|nr:sigma-70 family RNA polymerase sigma factor [Ilumatobacteraceae bacterium]